MRTAVIHTSRSKPSEAPVDAAAFWAGIARELAVSADGPLNIAQLAVDRHAASANADKTAFRFLDEAGNRCDVSYRELAALTDRFANLLGDLGVQKGDCVFVLCGRIPELYIAVLGALKFGAVVSPLFQAFGPEPVRARIAQGQGRVLVTTATDARWRRFVPRCPLCNMCWWWTTSAAKRRRSPCPIR
jgi:acetyl-CoA synthetase